MINLFVIAISSNMVLSNYFKKVEQVVLHDNEELVALVKAILQITRIYDSLTEI